MAVNNLTREYIPTINTKGLYHFNGTGDDSSGNGNNGTPTNVTWVGGKLGSGSAGFNGTISRIAIPNITFNASGEFTFSCYLKIPTGDSDYRAVIGFGNNYQLGSILFWKWNNNTPYICIQDTSNNSISLNPNINITDGVYRNFIFTYKNKIGVLYINGIQVATQTNNSLTGNFYNTVDNQLGCKALSAGVYHQFFNGNIDEVVIENRAWSAEEVNDYYMSSKDLFFFGEYLGAGSSTTKLLLHLNGNANDSSGNGNNGTPTNVTWVGGRLGSGSASLNGSNSYISCTGQQSGTVVNETISFYIKPSNIIATQYVLVHLDNLLSSYGIAFQIISSGNIRFIARNNVEDTFIADSGNGILTTSKRHNVIGVKNGLNLKLYVDSKNVGTATITGSEATNLSDIVNIGRIGISGVYYNGLIDEVIIENRAWTEQEIKKYYTYSKGKFIL